MHPGYKFMDSYPQHSTHMPCAPQHGLGFETVPPQMKVDPAGYPISYGPWPYGGSHGYPHPSECHTCCHYNQFPGYHAYSPQYPHFLPPPSVYGHGSYPSYPATHPILFVPSPHYSMETPRYELDKHAPRDHHCCGCPNHLHQPKEDRNVKIVEQDPDDEKKLSESLVPSQLKNSPYPIVWIPPGYMMNKEGKVADGTNSKMSDEKGIGNVKSFQHEPNLWNRWFPIDLNNLGYLNQGGEGNRTQHKQNEDMGNNSFPIFWMPHKSDQVEPKEMNGDKKNSEEPLYLRIPPMKLIDNGDKISQPNAQKENSQAQAGNPVDGKVLPKVIPVQQKEPIDQASVIKDVNKKDAVIHAGKKDDKAEKRHGDGSAKMPSSPPKKSKLPPVCLRVDPLPRKNSSGSSRSPSPPAKKGKSQEVMHESSKSAPLLNVKEKTKEDVHPAIHTDKNKEGVQSKTKTKTIKVADGANTKEKRDNPEEARTQASVITPVESHEKVQMSDADHQARKSDGQCSFEGEKTDSNIEDGSPKELTGGQSAECLSHGGKCEAEVEGVSSAKKLEANDYIEKVPKKCFSEAEAAVVIQSVYRGFEVRRWEPLKKLKEIAKIKDQVGEVKSRVQDLVSSYEVTNNDKECVVVGETIMNLLLKLDTVQGFTPTVRDIRKSVAKELVSLQEQLDSLATKKVEVSVEKATDSAHVEDVSSRNDENVCLQSKEQVANDEHDREISDASFDVKYDTGEGCQGESLSVTDVNLCPAYAEISQQVDNIVQVPIPSLPEDLDAEKVEVDSIPRTDVAKEDELNSFLQSTELSSPAETVLTGKESSTELSQGVPSQEPNAQDMCKDGQIDAGSCMSKPNVECDPFLHVSKNDQVKEMDVADEQVKELLNECEDASKQNNNIVPDGDNEKDEELVREAILESDLKDIATGEIGESMEPGETEQMVGSVKEVVKVAEVEKMEVPVVVLESKEKELELSLAEGDSGEDQRKESENTGLEMMEVVPVVVQEAKEKELELSLAETDSGEDQRKESENTGVEVMEVPVEAATENKEPELAFVDRSLSKDISIKSLGDGNHEDDNTNTVCDEEEESALEEKAVHQAVDEDHGTRDEQEKLHEDANIQKFESVTSDATKTNQQSRTDEEIVSPNVEQANVSVLSSPTLGNDDKIIEENKKFKEMMEKLIEAGKEQLSAISDLSGRVKELEKKLAKKKKVKVRKYRKSSS